MSILEHFPYPTFREGQAEMLQEVERKWHNHDVIVLILPTGWGKTVAAYTIADWAGEATTVVPNNVLLRQMHKEFPDLATIEPVNTYKTRAGYLAARANLRHNKALTSYHSYLGNKAYNSTIIVDEAAELVKFLKDKEAIKLWRQKENFPDNMYTTGDVMEWLKSMPKPMARHKKLLEKLDQQDDRYILEMATEMYKGKWDECLKLVPLTPRDNKPIMWPGLVKKIVLMSATFNEEDLYDLGLDRMRYTIIEGGSPIPPERRPFIYEPVGNVSYRNYDTIVPKLADYVLKWMETHPEKGMIHAPYGLASKLRKHLKHPRLMYHSRFDKRKVLDGFLSSDPADGRVLVGSGLTEGLSLENDLARWQLILKVPFANLRDRAVKAKMEARPRWYQWDAVKQVMQAAGRVSRGPEDYGITVMLDSNFERLPEDMMYTWFKEAIWYGFSDGYWNGR